MLPLITVQSSSPAAILPDASSAGCVHCGDVIGADQVLEGELAFCCQGCATVYNILQEGGLGNFYLTGESTGVRGRILNSDYAYLDANDTLTALCDFVDDRHLRLSLELPAVHCASCLWLLERLPRLCPAVRQCRVDLLSRRASLVVDRTTGTLSETVGWLERLGYPPRLSLGELQPDGQAAAAGKSSTSDAERLGLKIGIAGFAAGNVMLLAFPEYLGMSAADVLRWRPLFGALSLALAVPVLLFSGGRYLRGAWQGMRYRELNVDLPIALGMLAMFGHSLYEIVSGTGSGYLDSLLGLIFFLLVGRWFQRQTHRRIVFDRDYRDYLPLSARVWKDGRVDAVRLDRLAPGDIVELRDGELAPADGLLLAGEARLDTSFITGEDVPQRVDVGARVHAGSRQRGAPIRITLTGEVRSSYLAQLWSEGGFRQNAVQDTSTVLKRVGQYFSVVTLAVAVGTLAWWWPTDLETALRAATAVLIVACPCAASLALPFVYGRLAGLSAKQGLALRDSTIVERFAEVDASAFDKTGTLTDPTDVAVKTLRRLEEDLLAPVLQTVSSSVHPMSVVLYRYLGGEGAIRKVTDLPQREKVEELVGAGLTTRYQGQELRVGRADWASPESCAGANLVASLDGRLVGAWQVVAAVRPGVDTLLDFAHQQGTVALISGDDDRERGRWAEQFAADQLYFKQLPKDKLSLLESERAAGKQVLYVGDGLNDAGALRAAHVGVAVSSENGGFNPACDGVLEAVGVARFAQLWRFLAGGRALVYGALALAVIYNLIGLAFAVTGQLEPVIAAILMPLSSLTVVTYAWVATWAWARVSLPEAEREKTRNEF